MGDYGGEFVTGIELECFTYNYQYAASVSAKYDIKLSWTDRDSAIPFGYTLSRTLHYCPPAVAGCT